MNNKQQQSYFLKLYEPIHDRFERFCRARVYGEMEYTDLMNETLLLAFEKIDTLKSEQAFFSYLVGISIRILANNHRKKKTLIQHQDDVLRIDVNANTEHDAEVHLLHQALALLPEVQREALVLFEITGFTIKEIADMKDASESAIKQRLKRGREKLTQVLTFESTNYKKEGSDGNK